MNRSIDLEEVIGLAYEAALAPQRWTEVLQNAADMLGGDAGALHFQDQVTGKGWGMVARLDPAAAQSYFGYFATRNPIRRARNRLLQPSENSGRWRDQVVTDEHALPKTELMRSEYYNDFLRRFDIHSLLMMGLAVESTKFATINFLRPRRSSQFETGEIDLATRLQPHFIRAFDLSVKLTELRQLNATLAEALDHSPHGVFLVNVGARVRHLNRTAETLSAQRRGLSVNNGILCAETSTTTRALHRLIGAAAATDPKSRVGGAMPICRPDYRYPLSVIVVPLHAEHFSLFPGVPLALVCASDPECGTAAPEDRVRALFGLTAAEAKIAVELLSGCDPARIAERKSISVNTVRVHLARIMSKTETNRQADLVRLLERVSGLYVN